MWVIKSGTCAFARPITNGPRTIRANRSCCAPVSTTRHFRTRSKPRCSAAPALTSAEIASELVRRGDLLPADAGKLEALTCSRAALLAKVLANRTRHIAIVCDGVQGGHNVAAITRSCDAWGIQDLHVVQQQPGQLPKNATPIPVLEKLEHESVRNVSKNCHKWLSISEYASAAPCAAVLKRRGYEICVSSLSPLARPIQQVDVSKRVAFVFGNEKDGVSPEMKNLADSFFTLPMRGFVESMNVSVAVACVASQVTERCRTVMSESSYGLSGEEKKALIRSWLSEPKRRRVSDAQKISSRSDVTKLGVSNERRIVRSGLFVPGALVHDDKDYWKNALRLDVERGERVSVYFKRRKVGALSDFEWSKRCRNLSYLLSGTHALSCEAAIHGSLVVKCTRETFSRFFHVVSSSASDDYKLCFDNSGVPSLPVHAPEAAEMFANLDGKFARHVISSIAGFADDVLSLTRAELSSLIRDAGVTDIAHCIADTLRCDESRRSELVSAALDADNYFSTIRDVVGKRDRRRQWMNAPQHQEFCPGGGLNRGQRDILQVLLRFWNVGFLTNEFHQTVWERQLNADVSRFSALRFSLLETVLCDSYAEMLLVERATTQQQRLARIVFEWHDTLLQLQCGASKFL